MKNLWIKLVVIASLLIVVLLIVLPAKPSPEKPDPIDPNPNPEVVDPVTPDPLPPDLAVGQIHEEIEIKADDGTILVKGAITLPDLTGSIPDKALVNIAAYYDNAMQKSLTLAKYDLADNAELNRAACQENGTDFLPFTLYEDFEITFKNNNIISIIRTVSEFSGSGNEMMSQNAETFLLENGALLLLDDAFNVSEDEFMNTILNCVNDYIDSDNSVFFENAKQMAQHTFNKTNFYFKSEGFVVFYPIYAIAPYHAGMQSFIIPYETIGNILKDGIYER